MALALGGTAADFLLSVQEMKHRRGYDKEIQDSICI